MFLWKNQNPEQNVKPKTSLLPFPELCVPKHELNKDIALEMKNIQTLV